MGSYRGVCSALEGNVTLISLGDDLAFSGEVGVYTPCDLGLCPREALDT